MIRCDHQPTGEVHPKKGDVWRCPNCGGIAYNGPSVARCKGEKPQRPVEDFGDVPCHARGEWVMLFTKCGCGVAGKINVHRCPVYGLCTPFTIQGRVPGKARPQGCSACRVREA